MRIDRFDLLIASGLLLCGLAVGLAWGWVAALAYFGLIFLAVGLLGAAIVATRAKHGDRQ